MTKRLGRRFDSYNHLMEIIHLEDKATDYLISSGLVLLIVVIMIELFSPDYLLIIIWLLVPALFLMASIALATRAYLKRGR